ncbi:inhibitor of Bruton tyrosine kinase-like [Uranotaenia lowii]|uniref:inhibitor of Bruton tyrosine kinase-like n=1 Tax=Uranotaenia lowii TaxID=190385 RepID=UPI00247A3CC4|nr:inhibitor of Bruton tyrosine kinase-like [Uranotaenia lowii]
MPSTIATYEYECTRKCRLPEHGNGITAALTKRSISDELLAAFVAKFCRNFAEILDDQGRSALHLAASVGRYAVAEWLINHGASIALKDRESGHTPLHRAMYYGCVGVAVMLVKYGAGIDVPDEDFVNPLQLCSNVPKDKTNGKGYEIMVWGKNKNYNLGIGNVEGKEAPDFIDYFRKNRITIEKMSINTYHSVFLTKDGDVYTTGHGRGGRLGNGAENTVVYPTKVPVPTRNPESERIVDVSTGRYHTLLLSDQNCIYSCGENNHCQLGIKPPPEKQLTFTSIGGLHNFADKKIKRIIAKDYHSIAICEADVYVWGSNGGQFGMKKELNQLLTPKPLPLVPELGKDKPEVANRDTTIKLVESSNAAIVVYTQSSYLYIFKNFKTRTYKNPLMEKFECISVSGGEFVSKKEDVGKNSKPLRIIAFTVSRNIYIWYDDCQQFLRCVFAQSRNLEIEKIVWCNNHALVLLLGNLYHGTITHKLNAQAVTQISEYTETYTKKEMSTTNKTRIELKRIKMLNNVVDFVCDDDGENFAVLLENSRRHFNLPELVESNYDFGSLLAEAHEMDGARDVLFTVDYQTFPAHRFVLYHRCRHLRKLLEKKPNQKDFQLHGYEGLTGSIFELILRYIYGNVVISRGDVDKLVRQLNPGGKIDKENTAEMVSRLKKVFKQFEIGGMNESLKILSEDPFLEDYPKLPRDSYPDLQDVIIKLQDNQEIKAHKCVLMARLEYFNMMFSHSWAESKTVNLTTVPLEYMDPIIEFLYDNNYQRVRNQKYSDHFLFSMITICDQFFIDELKSLFEEILCDRINLRNVGELIEYAFQYNCDVLKTMCMQFISVNLARILELRSLDGLEANVLAQIDKFYKEFYNLADYRTITPSANAIEDEDLLIFVNDFCVDLNYKATDVTSSKSKTPKGKLTPKSTKTQLEKRNYEKEAMVYIRDLSFEEIPSVKTEEKKSEKVENGHSAPTEKEIKNWQKVVDKKDPKKKSIPVALKANEIIKNESKAQENFSNIKTILEKATSPINESGPSATTVEENDSGYGSSRQMSFNLSDFTILKPKLSQKQRKRITSTSESKPTENSKPVTTPEVSPMNPWKNMNNSAADMFKSEPIAITSPRNGQRKISTGNNGSFESVSPMNGAGSFHAHPATMATSPPFKHRSTIKSPPVERSQKEFSKIQEDERRQKQYYEKIKSKSLVQTQIEERAIEELRQFYNVDSVDDETITVERYRPQPTNAINFAVWQYQ